MSALPDSGGRKLWRIALGSIEADKPDYRQGRLGAVLGGFRNHHALLKKEVFRYAVIFKSHPMLISAWGACASAPVLKVGSARCWRDP
jgi:hypothetical protein